MLTLKTRLLVNICRLGSIYEIGCFFSDVDLELVNIVSLVDQFPLVWVLARTLDKLNVGWLTRKAITVCCQSVRLFVGSSKHVLDFELVPIVRSVIPGHGVRHVGLLRKMHIEHAFYRLFSLLKMIHRMTALWPSKLL